MFKKLYVLFFIFLNLGLFFVLKGIDLSILTAPIGHGGPEYTGHRAVTRSLIEGLQKIGASFNYNPKKLDDVGAIVIVLADTNALIQAIQLKKEGKIKKILAGPNLMVRSNEYQEILASPEIDICIVPSEWVKNAYIEDEPSLQDRIKVWYAGVDIEYWNPSRSFNQKTTDGCKKVLVYWKTEPESFCKEVEKVLKEQGLQPIRLQYGHYSNHHYKNTLEKVLFSIFLSRSESQGIALAESWAMDVPTLVWDAQAPHIINNKVYWPVLAAPYINNQTGLIWNTTEQLNELLIDINKYSCDFAARSWVHNNMSDEVSAQFLLNIANDQLP